MRVFLEYKGKLYEWKGVKGSTCGVCAMSAGNIGCPEEIGITCRYLRKYVGDVGGKYTHRFQEVPI